MLCGLQKVARHCEQLPCGICEKSGATFVDTFHQLVLEIIPLSVKRRQHFATHGGKNAIRGLTSGTQK